MAHLPGQQRLVLERLLEPGIGLLTFDRDPEQAGEAGKKIGVVLVELAGIGAVDFEHAEEGLALAALFDQHVDGAPDAVIRQQLGRAEAGIRLHVIRYDGLAGLVGVTRRRSDVGCERDGIDGARRPADPRAHHQTIVIRFIFQNLDERSLQSDGAQFGGLLQNLPKVAGLHGDAAELAKQRLLPQPIAKLVPAEGGGGSVGRFRPGSKTSCMTNSPNTGCARR